MKSEEEKVENENNIDKALINLTDEPSEEKEKENENNIGKNKITKEEGKEKEKKNGTKNIFDLYFYLISLFAFLICFCFSLSNLK